MKVRASSTPRLRLRKPIQADGARLHAFVLDAPLETNSRYAYLLLASHFRETCLLAERAGELVGFVAGYLVPGRTDTLFVWQVGVAPSARQGGLGLAMLRALLRRLEGAGVGCLEATVARGNRASMRLFEALARALGTSCTRAGGFVAEDFGDEDHEEEVLIRVGPWESPR